VLPSNLDFKKAESAALARCSNGSPHHTSFAFAQDVNTIMCIAPASISSLIFGTMMIIFAIPVLGSIMVLFGLLLLGVVIKSCVARQYYIKDAMTYFTDVRNRVDIELEPDVGERKCLMDMQNDIINFCGVLSIDINNACDFEKHKASMSDFWELRGCLERLKKLFCPEKGGVNFKSLPITNGDVYYICDEVKKRLCLLQEGLNNFSASHPYQEAKLSEEEIANRARFAETIAGHIDTISNTIKHCDQLKIELSTPRNRHLKLLDYAR
jgi:hypothetical protein